MAIVYLRALELDDLERTHQWHNNPALYETMVGAFRYVSRAAEEEWLRQKQAYSNQEVNLAICLTADSTHIGNIYLRSIDWIARHAEVAGLFIAEPGHRSKGYGTVALRLVIKHAFRDLGLLRLYCFVLEGNQPICRTVEKCGFIVEGKLRQHACKNGNFQDVLVLGLGLQDLGEWYEKLC
jgi:RimJ/RimL family protein N-acetyltransferase